MIIKINSYNDGNSKGKPCLNITKNRNVKLPIAKTNKIIAKAFANDCIDVCADRHNHICIHMHIFINKEGGREKERERQRNHHVA